MRTLRRAFNESFMKRGEKTEKDREEEMMK
jgi:hypothetical protein